MELVLLSSLLSFEFIKAHARPLRGFVCNCHDTTTNKISHTNNGFDVDTILLTVTKDTKM